MTEKFQYGQKLDLEVIETLADMKTDHSHVRYVKTRNHGNVLLMDDEIQFSTADEHRYHEMLVHPVMSRTHSFQKQKVLILGGGDGLAAREVFKWANVEHVTIVDWDAAFVDKFGGGILTHLNKNVFSRSNVTYIAEDALAYLGGTGKTFDVVFLDFPDPDGPTMVDLYTTCISLADTLLTKNGVIGLHVGPVHPNHNFQTWDTIRTLRDTLDHTFSGLNKHVELSTVYVPSFSNEWGLMRLCAATDIPKNSLWTSVRDRCKYWNGESSENVSYDIQVNYHNK
jgi:spermidine synthase